MKPNTTRSRSASGSAAGQCVWAPVASGPDRAGFRVELRSLGQAVLAAIDSTGDLVDPVGVGKIVQVMRRPEDAGDAQRDAGAQRLVRIRDQVDVEPLRHGGV